MLRSRQLDQPACVKTRLRQLVPPADHHRDRGHQPTATPSMELAALVRDDGAPLVVLSARGDIGVLTIGRGDEVDLQLAHPAISGTHATVRWDEGLELHLLTDCGSSNGTFVNRRRVTGPVALLDGVRIHLAQVALTYRRPYRG